MDELTIADGKRGIIVTLHAPISELLFVLGNTGTISHKKSNMIQIEALSFFGKDPSPPLQFGDGPTTLPLSTLSRHFSGVIATMLRACTGPSAATSSFNASLTSLCRDIGVRASPNLSEMTTTLKWVSEPVGLCSARQMSSFPTQRPRSTG